MADHLRDTLIAGLFEALPEGIQVYVVSDLKQQTVGIEKARRQQALHQGRDRNDHHAGLQISQAVQG